MLDVDTKKWLTSLMGDGVRFDEPMAAHTSFRVGGPADAFALPDSPGVLERLVRGCGERGIPYMLVGGGTNLLVKDRGIRGVVIGLKRCFSEIRGNGGFRFAPPSPRKLAGEECLFSVGAGARLPALCAFALRNGLGGVNFGLGIPGTVGGAIFMNAGTALGSISDVIESVKILTSSGEIERIEKEDLNFSYRRFSICRCESKIRERDSADNGNFVLLEGRFRLRPSDPEKLKKEARHLLEGRREKQPRGPSAGCFFKNPVPGEVSAGELIDRARLKGTRVRGAEVSPKHANFIMNRGGASAADILALAALIRETVAERFRFELETEVRIVGE